MGGDYRYNRYYSTPQGGKSKGVHSPESPHSLQFHMRLTILSRAFCPPMMADASPGE
jgi:hypothetical protein